MDEDGGGAPGGPCRTGGGASQAWKSLASLAVSAPQPRDQSGAPVAAPPRSFLLAVPTRAPRRSGICSWGGCAIEPTPTHDLAPQHSQTTHTRTLLRPDPPVLHLPIHPDLSPDRGGSEARAQDALPWPACVTCLRGLTAHPGHVRDAAVCFRMPRSVPPFTQPGPPCFLVSRLVEVRAQPARCSAGSAHGWRQIWPQGDEGWNGWLHQATSAPRIATPQAFPTAPAAVSPQRPVERQRIAE